jgi:glycine/D-amino acid oxidase-like deaminating enzyme
MFEVKCLTKNSGGGPEVRTKKSVTSKKILRAKQPLWAALPGTSVNCRKTASRNNYDVIIVGAGISGALAAMALLSFDKTILIVDRREPVRGSSLASTAMIQHEIDVPLHRLSRTIGQPHAERVWQRSAKAVDELAVLLEQTGIACEFERKNTLFLAGTDYGSRALQAEVDARQHAGLESRFIPGSALKSGYGIDRSAAITSSISASSNPAQMTAGILNFAASSGVEIVAGLEISDYRSIHGEVVVSTNQGQLLTCGHLVFCTGYEFLKDLANKSHSIVSTWAVASKPHLKRPDWLNEYLVWEGSDPYLYFRSTADGRVIVGGEDELSDNAYLDEGKGDRKFKRLCKKLVQLTGIEIGKPEYGWAAAFGTTIDGLPMIGELPGQPNVFATMGYGGNGITFSQIGASIITAEILGRRDPDAELFLFR